MAEYSFWKHFSQNGENLPPKKSLYWTLAPKPNFLNNKFIVSQFWHGLKILCHPLHIEAGCYMVFSTLACFMDFCLVTHVTISFAQNIHLSIVITTCYGFPSSSHIGICELNTPRLVNPSFFFHTWWGRVFVRLLYQIIELWFFFNALIIHLLVQAIPWIPISQSKRKTHLLCIRVDSCNTLYFEKHPR
jgi:hypothetical protein